MSLVINSDNKRGLASQTVTQLLHIVKIKHWSLKWNDRPPDSNAFIVYHTSAFWLWRDHQTRYKLSGDSLQTMWPHSMESASSSCFRGGDGNRKQSRSFESRNKSGVKDSVNRPKYLQPQSEHSRWHSESLPPQRQPSFINYFATEKKASPPAWTSLFDPLWVQFSVGRESTRTDKLERFFQFRNNLKSYWFIISLTSVCLSKYTVFHDNLINHVI